MVSVVSVVIAVIVTIVLRYFGLRVLRAFVAMSDPLVVTSRVMAL